MAETVFLALGSNEGDRLTYLTRAISALKEHPSITFIKSSEIFETEPVGGPPNQQDYLNAAVEIETSLSPQDLLAVLRQIENEFGRVRTIPNGPRTIDMDIILFGQQVIESTDLTIPHPRMHLRSFVLEPLAEIAEDVYHPTIKKTIGEIWDEFDPNQLPEPTPISRTNSLAGLRAVVTGSTSGIGKAIAMAFASAGASVIVHGRKESLAEQVTGELEVLGANTTAILADFSNLEECRELVTMAWEEWQGIDIWVNNAGADTLTGEAKDWPFQQKLRELFEIDVIATMLMSRDVGRRMHQQGSGVILNMGWDQAETGMEGDSGQLFAATKAAIMAFSKSLALSLAPTVRVNCLAPGWIQTKWGDGASEFWQKRVYNETPLRRWGQPEDVAAAACWLASPAASFITGQVIRVNGGVVR